MSIFFAYRNRDVSLVQRLVDEISAYDIGPQMWFAERDLVKDQNAAQIIKRQIDTCDVFLYCLGSAAPEEEPEKPDDPDAFHLEMETHKALERKQRDDDFRVLIVRLLSDTQIPRALLEVVPRVHVDLSGRNWSDNLPSLVEMISE